MKSRRAPIISRGILYLSILADLMKDEKFRRWFVETFVLKRKKRT